MRIRFKIISGFVQDDVEHDVNNFLAKGWSLHGELKVIPGPAFCQAMALCGEEETEEPPRVETLADETISALKLRYEFPDTWSAWRAVLVDFGKRLLERKG